MFTQKMESSLKFVGSEVKSLSHVLLFAKLWTVAYKAPLSMGFSRQEYWSGLPCPPPGDLNSGVEPTSLKFLSLAGEFFTMSTTREFPLPHFLKDLLLEYS